MQESISNQTQSQARDKHSSTVAGTLASFITDQHRTRLEKTKTENKKQCGMRRNRNSIPPAAAAHSTICSRKLPAADNKHCARADLDPRSRRSRAFSRARLGAALFSRATLASRRSRCDMENDEAEADKTGCCSDWRR